MITRVPTIALLPLPSVLLMMQVDVLEKQLALMADGRRLEREAFQTQVYTYLCSASTDLESLHMQ